MTVLPMRSGVKVQFTHDTEAALALTTALVNTSRDGVEELVDAAALTDFVGRQSNIAPHSADREDVRAVLQLREQLAVIWEAVSVDDVVAVVNELFRDAGALPRLTNHDGFEWHMHFTTPEAPLAQRLGTYAAMGIADLVRADDLDRLKRCDAEDCDAVLVDLSRNRSRRYCDTGNCGNRLHVAAYRARKASA